MVLTKQNSGNCEVQAQLYLESIKALNQHLKRHPHDFVTKRVLLRRVALRKRMLRYLKKHNFSRYQEIVQ